MGVHTKNAREITEVDVILAGGLSVTYILYITTHTRRWHRRVHHRRPAGRGGPEPLDPSD